MARLVRAFPELLILVKAMAASARSVLTTLILLVIVLYVYGIAFTQLTRDTRVGLARFSRVSDSMYTLLLWGVLCLDNVEGIAAELSEVAYALNIVFFSFILLASLTVMNMLIGVLTEIVGAVAAAEKDAMMLNYVHHKLQDIMLTIDKDGSGSIDEDEFKQLIVNEQACRALNDVGVDVAGLVDFADVIFGRDENSGSDEVKSRNELKFPEFMEIVLQLRGCNTATVKDIIELRKLIKSTAVVLANEGDTDPDTVTRRQQYLQTNKLMTTLPSAPPAKPFLRPSSKFGD